jgi:beta-glucanase (GH16 family)
VDLQKWSFQNGDGCDIGPDLCGWGNNELQWYQAQNAVVEDGILKIIAKRESQGGKAYTSSRMRTINKGDWTYGRFEASIKLPTGQGLWPAFWMLPTREVYGKWPQSGEIDIVELVGHEPNIAHATIHYGNIWPNNQSSTNIFELASGIFNDEFHEFAVEWEPNVIRWYIDGYLYSTKTRNDIGGFRWPFDQDFHFLLNVAVGGNWPGNPSSSTVFPQTMEVDYVRVYDRFPPSISGDKLVSNQAQGVAYKINNLPENATITWELTGDGEIASGQGTEEVMINWGSVSGQVEVRIESACGSQHIKLNVAVEPPFVKEQSFENFDDAAQITRTFSTGNFEDNTSNPAGNAVNSSDLVGKYTRSGSEQFDILVYEVRDLGNVSTYLDGTKRFYIDVYTSAPIGTPILLQLENKSLAQPSNFPRGRHSRFDAKTTVQNEWERLEFKFLDRPDNAVSNSSIDQFIFLFASNTRTNDTYYFDNFDSYGKGRVVSNHDVKFSKKKLVKISPNPVSDVLLLENISSSSITKLQIIDLNGKVMMEKAMNLAAQETQQIHLENVPKGIHIVKFYTASAGVYTEKIIHLGK